MLYPLISAVLLASTTAATPTDNQWKATIAVLEQGIQDRVFPGAVALVGNSKGTLLRVAVGNLTYDSQPTPAGDVNLPTTIETIFDMASCSKVTATTTAVALLFGANATAYDTPVATYLPGYEGGGKGPVTLRNCLLHNAGLPPDPTPYDYWDPAFGCVGAPLPSSQTFHCSEQIYDALLKQTLRPNATIGGSYVYSDLSFITLMYVVGTVALERGLVTTDDFLPRCGSGSGRGANNANSGMLKQCAFEAFVRLHVFEKLNMMHTGYLPHKKEWSTCQPTWVPDGEPGMRGHALQGQVEDGNCYNMGGVAGHAGVFSNAEDLSLLMRMWMKFDGAEGSSGAEGIVGSATTRLLDDATIDLFVKINNHSQSSRALGWNTNDITALPDGGWNLSCGNLSKYTFTHVGFTGTQLCGDPVNDVFTVLLTARVYGSSNTENSTGIHAVRQQFNSEVVDALKQNSK